MSFPVAVVDERDETEIASEIVAAHPNPPERMPAGSWYDRGPFGRNGFDSIPTCEHMPPNANTMGFMPTAFAQPLPGQPLPTRLQVAHDEYLHIRVAGGVEIEVFGPSLRTRSTDQERAQAWTPTSGAGAEVLHSARRLKVWESVLVWWQDPAVEDDPGGYYEATVVTVGGPCNDPNFYVMQYNDGYIEVIYADDPLRPIKRRVLPHSPEKRTSSASRY